MNGHKNSTNGQAFLLFVIFPSVECVASEFMFFLMRINAVKMDVYPALLSCACLPRKWHRRRGDHRRGCPRSRRRAPGPATHVDGRRPLRCPSRARHRLQLLGPGHQRLQHHQHFTRVGGVLLKFPHSDCEQLPLLVIQMNNSVGVIILL